MAATGITELAEVVQKGPSDAPSKVALALPPARQPLLLKIVYSSFSEWFESVSDPQLLSVIASLSVSCTEHSSFEPSSAEGKFGNGAR